VRISLFGIGYVGSVSAACLSRDGHTVIAVDTHPQKVEAFNRGCAPMVEPGLEALVQSGVASGRLTACASAERAVAQTDLSIVCVGTPSAPDGSLDLAAVERVAATIGRALAVKTDFHAVVVRSTLTVGAALGRIAPVIERASGLKAGIGFGFGYYPEFLREGSAIRDYDDPSLSVIAATDGETVRRLQALHPPSAPAPSVVSFEEAEAVKSVSNAWHAVKISFANEIGSVLHGEGLDSQKVMALVCRDRRLNISSAYLRPGFAFGGSCLPKDLRAFRALAAASGRPTPVLAATLAVNEALIERAAALVEAAGAQRVSMLGLAFKCGTDDLRESPCVALAERLIVRGFDLRLFDPGVRPDRLTGANRAYALERLPELRTLLCQDLAEAVQHGETLVIAHPDLGASALRMAGEGRRVVDLARARPDLRSGGDYQGLAW
jgi:GDP-mannose 6-dehydrogenase